MELKPLLSLVCFSMSVILALQWVLSKIKKEQYKLPPSPFKLPIIGNLHQIGFHPHRSLSSLGQRHGSLMLLHLGRARTLIVSSASAAQEVFKTNDRCFSNRPEASVVKKLLQGSKDIANEPYGETWRHMRGIVNQQLLTPKKLLAQRTTREEETAILVEKIKQSAGSPFDLSEMLYNLTIDLMFRNTFGKKHREDREGMTNFNKLLEELFMMIGDFDVGEFIPWLGWLNYVNGLNSRIKRVSQKFDSFLTKIVDDHMTATHTGARSQDHMDFVDVLLQNLKDRDSDVTDSSGFTLGVKHIKGIIADMFLAGTETITITIEWALSELLRHPEMMVRVKKEIRGIVGSQECVTEESIALAKMDYLKAVIKETHRMHLVAPLLFPRESIHDVKIQGYDIPAKTRVMVNAWAIARDPSSWDNPDVFDPDRFLKSDSISASRDFKGQHFEFIPFGSGRRGCPGIAYADAVIELVMATLLHKFDWSLPGGAKPEDLDMSEVFGIAVKRKCPLVVVAAAAAAPPAT